jgi:hypothetical protein
MPTIVITIPGNLLTGLLYIALGCVTAATVFGRWAETSASILGYLTLAVSALLRFPCDPHASSAPEEQDGGQRLCTP